MPHQCTNCGRTFPDGSKEMLSGCPDCGGNKFKFDPSSRTSGADPTPESGTVSNDTAESTDQVSSTTEPADNDPFADHEWPDTASTEPPDAHDKTGPAGEPTIDTAGDPTTDTDDLTTDTDKPTTNADETPATDTDDLTTDTDKPTTDTDDLTTDSTESPGSTKPTDSGGFEYSSAAERSAASRGSGSSDAESSDSSRSPDTATDRPGARSGERPHADVETASDADGTTENSAQASARSEVVSGTELPDHTAPDDTTQPSDAAAPADADPAGDDESTIPEEGDPGFERMRRELNEQFESIRIVRPGEYELNLVELYDREEFIISLREDGRYVIEMPDAWDTGTE